MAAGPDFELFFVDPDYDIVYELEGVARYAHWVPDHAYSTMYSYLVFPDFAFEGTITVAGVAHHVSGVGALDHVNGRNVASPTSPGVGFWHYDPVAWEGGGVSNLLYFVGSSGETVVGAGVTTVPDGAYHPAPSLLRRVPRGRGRRTELGRGGGQPARSSEVASPARGSGRGARVRGPGRRGSRAVRRSRDRGELAVRGSRRVLRRAEGAEIRLRGRGYSEFMGGSIDISKLARGAELR